MTSDWQIGDKIEDRWEIYKIIRSGGMGIVYVVYDHQREWDVLAAKTFRPELFDCNAATAERFCTEALVWIGLDLHQNVTQAQFVTNIHGRPFLFMEYVAGGDLQAWIGSPRLTKDLGQVLRFAIQFCDGISHALSKGVKVHRDIKPQNCLITKDQTLKVTDFGLAKAFDEVEPAAETPDAPPLDAHVSSTGTAAGTCTHMAPEQFVDAKHVDVRADIYSFGVLLYQMLTGDLPFAGRAWQDFRRLHETQPIPDPKSKHKLLDNLVKTCLAKDPANRFGNFQELRQCLSDIYKVETGHAFPPPIPCLEHDARTWCNKGASLDALERPEEALACYEQALRINPRYVDAWSNKGVVLVKLGRVEEALACDDRALEIEPRNAEKLVNKAGTLVALGRHEEGLACYDKALEINPNLDKAWYSKGVTFGLLGRDAEALDCYQHAIDINPQYEEAWFNRGTIWGKVGDPVEALYAFNKALEINPGYAAAWFNTGVAWSSGFRQYAKALECFERAQRLGHPNTSQVIAVCRQMLGI
jgi:serine/threonine protein kinase